MNLNSRHSKMHDLKLIALPIVVPLTIFNNIWKKTIFFSAVFTTYRPGAVGPLQTGLQRKNVLKIESGWIKFPFAQQQNRY